MLTNGTKSDAFYADLSYLTALHRPSPFTSVAVEEKRTHSRSGATSSIQTQPAQLTPCHSGTYHPSSHLRCPYKAEVQLSKHENDLHHRCKELRSSKAWGSPHRNQRALIPLVSLLFCTLLLWRTRAQLRPALTSRTHTYCLVTAALLVYSHVGMTICEGIYIEGCTVL